MNQGPEGRSFAFKDCALAAIATGLRAQNLRELRDRLLQVDSSSIYHHFWGGLLRPQFDEPEYNNDFAAWAHRALRDHIAAERLSVIDPTTFPSLEELRDEVVDVIEQRLAEHETLAWSKPDEQFSFIRSQIVVFDTHRSIEDPAALAQGIPESSTSSVFYHFIDARRRTPKGRDDYTTWLCGFDGQYDGLVARLADIDPYFVSLRELREQLSAAVGGYFQEQAKENV
ncbi:MAG: hypothetical protein KFF77_09435 [Bacteroidetes bacterium]|nr:hypothetical protein [Bacteroidota bacterium]